MSVIGGFLELLGIAMIFPVMLILTSSNSGGGQVILNFCQKFLPDMPELKIAFILSLLMIFVFMFKNIFMMIYIYSQNEFVRHWADYVNTDITKKLLFAPYKTSSKIEYGDKEAFLSTVVRAISLDFVLRCIILFANLIVALFIIGLLFYKFTLPAFLSTVFILSFAYFENLFFKNKAKKLGDIGVKLENTLNQDVNFVIKSQKEIILSNKQEFFADFLINSSKKLSDNFSKRISYGSYPLYVTEIGVILSFLIMIATITFGGNGSKAAIISSLAVIGLIVLRLVPQLNKVLISMYNINVSKQKVIWFLDEYEKISNLGYETFNTNDKINFQNEIILQNVSYFHEKDKGIKDINLTVKKGEFIGIMGASGAGKTTLVDIISGLNIKDTGDFFVDNTKITEHNLQSLRNIVSFLPQESVFLDDTVLKNIAWGEAKDKIDLQKAKESLELAGLDIDINSDMNLSMGQKKRVALARAYYRNFEILILDEATSSLDIESENIVMQNILKLKGNKTVIAIAHRLSTLKKCDKIFYLKEGEIKDTGTLDELRTRNAEIDHMLKISSFD